MTLTIGRASLTDTLNDISITGDRLTVSFDLTGTSVNDMIGKRQQLVGLIDNPDEPVVPVTWSEDATGDGFYRVTGLTVPSTEVMLVNGYIVGCTAQLQRVPNHANAAAEVTTQSVLRANAHGYTVPPSVIAFLGPFTLSEADLRPSLTGLTSISRTAETGACTVRTVAAPQALTTYRDVQPPASHYIGACKIEYSSDGTTWYEATGRQLPARKIWRISNGIVRLTSANGATSGKFEVYDAGAWVSINVSHVTNGAVGPGIGAGDGSTQPYVSIRRNSPEQVTVRTAFANGDFTYTIQRGAMIVLAAWSVATATKYGNGFTANVASTAVSTWGIRATSNDANGNRLVFGMPVAITSDVANGRINASTAATTGQMFFGVELDGSSAIAGNAAADLANQYFGATSWRQQVVAR